MTKRILFIMILIVSVLMLYGCGNNSSGSSTSSKDNPQSSTAQTNSSASAARVVLVKISNYAFDPQTVTINKGDTIKWTNQDSMAHTATGKTFDSGNLDKDASFQFTFNDAGTFDYVCSYHASMKGQVIVK